MIVSVFGRTDKRAIIYTLLKLFQTLGDVCFITNNRHCTRLTEDGSRYGTYQNIHIFVTDATSDEVFTEIGHNVDDFDFIVMDGLYMESTDLTIYAEGAGKEERDEDILEILHEPQIVRLGYGKGCVPYTKQLFMNIEYMEYYRKLIPIDATLTNALAKILAPKLNIPVKNIVKVVSRK